MAENRIRMLMPLDGSPEAESILPALLPYFRTQKVRLTLFGVVSGHESASSFETYFARLRTSLLLDGVASESKVAGWGDPADEILRLGKPPKFDLIAMTTHGRSGLGRVLAGSVTENVLRHSEVPVLACRPGTRVGEWNKVLVALDGSSEAEAVLPDAIRLARTLQASIHLVKVKNPLMPATYHGIPLQLAEEDAGVYLERIADRLAMEGILTLSDVRAGVEATEIAAFARDIGAGLISMTTHGRSGVSRLLLGSVAENVLRAAPCPVLLRRTAVSRIPEPLRVRK